MKSIDLCEAHALQPFVACLKRRGIETERYLERQGIPPELVAAGEGKIIKRLGWKFFADVTRHEGIGTLGFLDGDHFTSDHLGSLTHSLKCAVTLQDAIDTFAQLISAFAQGNTVWLKRGEDLSLLCCHTEGLDPRAHVPDDFTVLVLISIVRLATGNAWRPSAIGFQTEDNGRRRVSNEFTGIDIQHLQSCSTIAFPTHLLAAPLRTGKSNNTGPKQIQAANSQPLDQALQLVLESLMRHHTIPTCNKTAEMLGISRRTLHRGLQAEGITYQRLVERARFDTARQRLPDKSTSIKEIAFDLGYSGTNNFSRAFKRISGITPEHYRRNHQE